MPDRIGLGYIEEARRRYHDLGDLLGEANALWALGNYHYFRNQAGNGTDGVPGGARRCSGEPRT